MEKRHHPCQQPLSDQPDLGHKPSACSSIGSRQRFLIAHTCSRVRHRATESVCSVACSYGKRWDARYWQTCAESILSHGLAKILRYVTCYDSLHGWLFDLIYSLVNRRWYVLYGIVMGCFVWWSQGSSSSHQSFQGSLSDKISLYLLKCQLNDVIEPLSN